jgi:Holliday junction DNA helicase RuvA
MSKTLGTSPGSRRSTVWAKKTAERLVLELKEKAKGVAVGAPKASGRLETKGAAPQSDLVSALVNLGFKPGQAEQAAATAAGRLGEDATFELLFREALKSVRTTSRVGE